MPVKRAGGEAIAPRPRRTAGRRLLDEDVGEHVGVDLTGDAEGTGVVEGQRAGTARCEVDPGAGVLAVFVDGVDAGLVGEGDLGALGDKYVALVGGLRLAVGREGEVI